MRIKLDENLPSQLAPQLSGMGHDVETVIEERRSGQPDPEIWDAAQDEARFLVTQDLDFSDARRFAPGSHHGLLLIRLRNPSRRTLLKRIGDLFRQENTSEWLRCFVVATERKVRVRRPAGK